MIALSIRQPWAWLIVHGHKPIENRTWRTTYRGPFQIHASSGMTRREYLEAVEFAAGINPDLATLIPMPHALLRGGIIGEGRILNCVKARTRADLDGSHEDVSPDIETNQWFAGPYGFVIGDARPLPFRPCRGSLGFFTVHNL